MDVRKDLISKLTLFYRPPAHIEVGPQAKAYLEELVDTFVRMKPTWDEWDYCWDRFKREHKTTIWPTPAAFPALLNDLREVARESARIARDASPPPPLPESREDPDYDHGAFLEAIETARRMSESDDYETARWGHVLLKMAGKLVEDYDDNGTKRFVPEPKERERYGLPGKRAA